MNGMARGFSEASEITSFPKGSERILQLLDTPVGLATFEPGWRWSNDVRPLAGTERCSVWHLGYALAGALHVELQDGSTLDVHAGELFAIPPGHDAWVVGDEACTILDWGGKVREYAKPARAAAGGAR